MSFDADTADLSWLAEHRDLVPDTLEAVITARHTAQQRQGAVAAALEDAQEALKTAGGSPDNPLAGIEAATRLVALERLAAELPPVPEVGQGVQNELGQWLRAALGDQTSLTPGTPPLAAAALLHHVGAHAGRPDLPPVLTDADVAAIGAFVQVSERVAGLVTNYATVIANVGRTAYSSVVGAAAGLLPKLDEARAEVGQLREQVDAADAAFAANGRTVCRAHGEIPPLPPVAAGQPWSLDKAVRR